MASSDRNAAAAGETHKKYKKKSVGRFVGERRLPFVNVSRDTVVLADRWTDRRTQEYWHGKQPLLTISEEPANQAQQGDRKVGGVLSIEKEALFVRCIKLDAFLSAQSIYQV